MTNRLSPNRRDLGHALLGLGTLSLGLGIHRVRAAAPDGAGSIMNMIATLQASKTLSFRAEMTFGPSVAKNHLKTLGGRTAVVFQRPDTLFAAFGEGGEEDIQLLISGGQATLFRLSLAAKAVLPLVPANGAAFSVPGFFIPFLGLLSADAAKDLFGEIKSLTPISEGSENQTEPTTLVAALGSSFTGEVWTKVSDGLPNRLSGTWLHSDNHTSASAVVSFSDWSSEPPVEGGLNTNEQVDQATTVDVDALGL